MKTIEERQTTWMDQTMPADERAAFEAELSSAERNYLEQERAIVADLREGLRHHLAAPPLEAPDFFNHRIMQTIREEEAVSQPADTPAGEASESSFWHRLGRLAWLGAGAVALAVVLTASMIPRGGEHAPIDYSAQVIQPRVPADVDGISAVAFHSEESDLTVLWLDGLEYLPDTHAIN